MCGCCPAALYRCPRTEGTFLNRWGNSLSALRGLPTCIVVEEKSGAQPLGLTPHGTRVVGDQETLIKLQKLNEFGLDKMQPALIAATSKEGTARRTATGKEGTARPTATSIVCT